jgi:D-3-phosphoglycerate dehydrogenase
MPYIIIDFDSTLVKVEGLEELAKIVLAKNPDKENILKKIQAICNLGMSGKISFPESLGSRMQLLAPTKSDLQQLNENLKDEISSSILRNRNFFIENREYIYIISGGFYEWIEPISTILGMKKENILANHFSYDANDEINGYADQNVLAQKQGKVKALKQLKLKGEIIVLGDGFTDYEIIQEGLATRFYAFTENVIRPEVIAKAAAVVNNFEEFLKVADLH